MANIALVEDHVLLRRGLAVLIKELGNTICFEADNGKDCIAMLAASHKPDIILMDINMPVMDGYETALFVKNTYPAVKVLALSMYDDETAVIRMLKNGARGYILKNCDPMQLTNAIQAVMNKGYYHSDLVSSRLIHAINNYDDDKSGLKKMFSLNAREVDFLKLTATELTYKEMASKMHVSFRTVDGYREALFLKLNIKSRVGLVIYAIKNGIVIL